MYQLDVGYDERAGLLGTVVTENALNMHPLTG